MLDLCSFGKFLVSTFIKGNVWPWFIHKNYENFSFQFGNRNIAGTRFKFDFPFACRRVGPLWATSENIRVTIWGWPDGIFSSGWKAIIVQTYHMLRPLSLGLDTIMAITIQTHDSRCEYSKHATRLFAQTWAAPEFSIEAQLIIGTQVYHISMCRTLLSDFCIFCT